MRKRVLVTGGAGFIGSHLVDGLIEDGSEVVVLDNESTGSRENVNPQAEYVKGDVTNSRDVERAFQGGLDVVCHIAGQASTIRSFDDPEADLRVNVDGTINIVKGCIQHRVPRLLYASSMTAYGNPETLPISENQPCSPISYYGITKYAAERYVHATADRKDLDFELHVSSFRMFNVYGERQRLDNPYQGVVGIFTGNLLRGEPITIHSDGEQSRDFVHIRDVVDAWSLALHNKDAYGQVFNLGSEKRKSINQLVDVILSAFGHSRGDYQVVYAPVRPGDQRHMEADILKARQVLGWNPRVAFEEGMERTIHWAIGSQGVSGRSHRQQRRRTLSQ